MQEHEIHGAIGDDGFGRLARAFYAQIPGDDLLGPMYPNHDWEGAEWRLREFLIGRFGGPMRYVEQRGHPRLRMRHAGFPIDQRARDRWIQLMDRAIEQAALPEEPARMLRAFFAQTATFLINRAPDGQPSGGGPLSSRVE